MDQVIPSVAASPSGEAVIAGDNRLTGRDAAGSVYDGVAPSASLIDANGTLYGMTAGGGSYYSGTVFALTP
jgi:uncharacterized repeat protein (TIGR03803 family)